MLNSFKWKIYINIVLVLPYINENQRGKLHKMGKSPRKYFKFFWTFLSEETCMNIF